MRIRHILLLLIGLPLAAQAQDWTRLVDLRGTWRFQLGDDFAWADPALDDRTWDEIFAPSSWEDEGFFGYDGFAWYRTEFRIPKGEADQPLFLRLGRIDDVDAVYVNGHFVGTTGRFPPDYQTAFHNRRVYRIPPAFLNPTGRNILAVRVFDAELAGGLIEAPLGLYTTREIAVTGPALLLDLSGAWAFRPGEHPPNSDEGWHSLTVPGNWEPQGFEDLNGFAWYRKRFTASRSWQKHDLVLVLGKIDDLDEVYVNGRRIGGLGDMRRREVRGEEWEVVRIYPIPPDLLRYGATNEIRVRVFDGLVEGGIYAGPVGIATPDAVQAWQQAAAPGLWDRILRFFGDTD